LGINRKLSFPLIKSSCPCCTPDSSKKGSYKTS
jgi:hypothetical protein